MQPTLQASPPSHLRADHQAETKRLSELLDEQAGRACAGSAVVERRFLLDGHQIHLRAADADLANRLTRALSHLPTVAAAGEPDLTIDCWAADRADLAFPWPQWPREYFSARGEIMGLDCARLRIAYFGWLGLLNAYFPNQRRAFYCLQSEATFSLQQAGSPALTIFNWWAEHRGLQLVHAAVLGRQEGAVLIAGHGGAGKSTLAFSALDTDLRYLADDYCLLASGPARAIGLFSSGKLTDQSRATLPDFATRNADAFDEVRQKSLYYLHDHVPQSLLPQAPLRAIILSELSHETRLDSADSREIHGVLAESTMKQLAGTHYPTFLRIRRLLDGLPCFRLRHGPDRAEAHALLRSLCVS